MNAVQLFILVWTYSAVCQADTDISVSCGNVTGSVGKEVNLTCSVSLQNTECCIKMYMFKYPDKFNDSEICKKELTNESCEQRNSFTCSYTPTTAMTEQFSFFLQTKCGRKSTKFPVVIRDGCSVSCDDVTGTVAKEVTFTCSVPRHCAECSIKKYMFQNPESYKDSITCNQELPNSFTCRFTPTTEMKEKFKFFVRTQCGVFYPTFSVNIAGPLLRKADEPEDTGFEDTGSKNAGSMDTVIAPVVGLFVIIILIIILMTIICKKQSFRFQFLCIKHNDDNSNCPENVI